MKTLSTLLSALILFALYGALTTAPHQWVIVCIGLVVVIPAWGNVYRNSKKNSNELV